MKNKISRKLKFEAECFELTNTLNEYDKLYNNSRNQISMHPLNTILTSIKSVFTNLKNRTNGK